MPWFMAGWRIVVDYFTPDSLRGDWEGMRRLRLLVGLSLLGLILGGTYGLMYLTIGHYWGVAIIVACILLQSCVPFLIRATGRVRLGGHLSLVVWGLGFSGLTALEGGVHGFSIVWLACGCPLLALLILNRFEALLWCAFGLVSTLFFSVLEISHIVLPLAYPEHWRPAVAAGSIFGIVIFMSLLGILFEYARKEAVVSMQSALNELSEANARTHQSERFAQRVAGTMPGLVYMLDLQEQSIVYANERLMEALGFLQMDSRGIKIKDLKKSPGTPDFETILEGARQSLRGVRDGSFVETEYTFNYNSAEFYWECRDTVFSRRMSGEPLFVLGLAVNVTEQKRTERAKLVAEGANRAKDRFLAVLSHELRTPLTPVLATLSEMELHEELPLEARTDLTMVRRNVELEAKLIDDLLDVTRISSGKFVLHLGLVDVHSCLQSALEICRADLDAKEIQVAIEFRAERHYVQADPVRLRQVFWNLLRNAVKFTPCHGRIDASTTNIRDKLRIEITDTGVGIEPEIIPRIFNAFEQGEQTKTRRFGGLGLGLSIAKTVVDMHHGEITASSQGRDKGATFIVELDAVAAELEQPTPILTSEPTNGKLPRILLVEDDLDTLQVLSKLLQRHGYDVMAANSVHKGMELAAKRGFDMVISDLGLPDGSGLEFMQQIKGRYGVPGIALSGYGTDEDLRQSRAAGFEQHIIKPVNFHALRAAIQRITAR